MKRIAIATDRQKPQASVFPFMQNYANEGYTEAVIKGGGVPLLVPYCEPIFTDKMLEGFDALILMGGNDVSPILYGEENRKAIDFDESLDRFHMSLITEARKIGIPILGICRGFQLLNVAFGGTLYQDIESEKDSTINHTQLDRPCSIAHQVQLVEGSNLYRILKEKNIGVNSLHHQGIKDLGFGLNAVAYAPDGLIEAFEGEDVFGVQWHPEAMSGRMTEIFSGFIKDIIQ